jgi:transcriptional regulator NrdR family protein
MPLKCPKCGSIRRKVIETRQSEYLNEVKRLYKCRECGQRYTTIEMIETEVKRR